MDHLPQETIRRKRDGGTLDGNEIRQFVNGMVDGSVRNEQVSALAMAVFFRGLDLDERVALTLAMRDSGTVLSWPELSRPVVDKHSTGGIGDKVSLMLAPALAACGAAVPMISGRGLGHTGGTLDKLDSVPGYKTNPDSTTFRRVVQETGCAIIGQTDDLAPADRLFYAIRDVTGTVESLDLITASILSKKLAAGLDALVLDVKCGSGAFMETIEDARGLAESLVTVANGAGTLTTALITDMHEPLASTAGNGLEVRAAIDFLTRARVDERVEIVTSALGGELLALVGLADDPDAGRDRILQSFADGSATECFARMVAGLGGPTDLVENPDRHLGRAAVEADVFAGTDGFVTQIDTRSIGLAVIGLGGGRRAVTDPIDYDVGFSALAGIGARVDGSNPIARVHARSEADAERASAQIRDLYSVGPEAPAAKPPVILERIDH